MKNIPWDDIRVPVSDFNTRLAAGTRTVPLYWGRDSDGHCLLIIVLEGDHTIQYRRDVPPVHGMRIDLRQSCDMPDCQNLILILEQHVDRDLFSRLCETLIETLAPVTDSATALMVTMAHLKRWKAFMAGRKTGLLSGNEIRGLFGELNFLRQLYQKSHLHTRAAVSAWCGPDGIHQDFIFSDDAVEIKTISGRERNRVRISSEDQLESQVDHLYLCVLRLIETSESEHAMSLNEMVQQIENELTEEDVIEEFTGKLAAYGYMPVPEYNQPTMQITGRAAFIVSDQFPRLIRSGLPQGIVRVSYDVELEHLEAFRIQEDQIFMR